MGPGDGRAETAAGKEASRRHRRRYICIMSPRPVPETQTIGVTHTEITRTDCRQCGTEVHGIAGRYACAGCGWVNHWAEGDSDLPSESDDLNWDR
jgi:ribosomal protein L37E